MLFIPSLGVSLDFTGGAYRIKRSGEKVEVGSQEIKPQSTQPVPAEQISSSELRVPSGTTGNQEPETRNPEPLPDDIPPEMIRNFLKLIPRQTPSNFSPEQGFELIGANPQVPALPPVPEKPFVNHEVFEEILSKYLTKSGWVDYRSIKRDKEAMENLQSYVSDLSALNPSTLEDHADKVASWLNLYNAIVMNEILKKYPVQNMMQIKNFFGEKKHKIGDKVYSLMEIEEEVFQKEIVDPRTVFARVNGSSSGPQFMKAAYNPRKLDQQLEERTWKYLLDPQHVRFDKKRATLVLSATFLWYEKELVDSIAFLRNYLDLLPKYFQVAHTGYDWRLNDEKLH